MALGIIPGSEIATPSSGVQIDPTAFRNAALMRGKVGAAIGQDAGGFLQDLANNIQDARNAKTVFKADLAMKQAYSNFTLQLQKEPELNDPEKWRPAWQQQVDQVKESVLNQQNLGPAVKAHLEAMTGNWEQQTMTAVQMNALKREAADTKEAGLKDVNWNYNSGELEKGDAGVDALLEARVLPGPKTAAALKKQGRTTWALSQANSAIATSGYKAPDILKQVLDANPGLVPAKQERILKDNALAAQRRAQGEKEQQVRDMVIQDPAHALADERIDGMKKEGIISDRGAADLRTLRNNFAKADKTTQARQETQELSIAMMEVDSQAVALTGPGGGAKAAELKAAGDTWTDAKKKKQLDDYVDRKVKGAENPVERETFRRMNEDREKNGLTIPTAVDITPESKGIMGLGSSPEKVAFKHLVGGLEALRKLPEDDIEKEYGYSSVAKLVQAEQDHFAQINKQMRDFFATYPQSHNGNQPSQDEADDYLKKIEHPYVSKATSAELAKHVPITVNSEEEFNDLPSGARFLYNGRIGTKN